MRISRKCVDFTLGEDLKYGIPTYFTLKFALSTSGSNFSVIFTLGTKGPVNGVKAASPVPAGAPATAHPIPHTLCYVMQYATKQEVESNNIHLML